MFPQRGVSPFRRLSEHHPLKSLLPKRTAQQGPAPRPAPGLAHPTLSFGFGSLFGLSLIVILPF